MLVVPSGDIPVTGNIALRQNRINLVQTVTCGGGSDQPRLKLDFTVVWQIDVSDWAEYAVLIDRVNVIHGDRSLEVILF